MKQKEKTFDLFFENITKEKKLNDDYKKMYDDVLKYVSRHHPNTLKANILLSTVLDQMIEHQNDKNNIQLLIPRDIKSYIQGVEKNIHYKTEIEKLKKFDLEKYTISGLWMTMCAYLVLLFVKEFLTDHYLIAFSIDLLVGVISLVLVYRGIRTHLKMIERYQISKKAFLIEVVGFVIGLIIVLLTLKSPFDISFLILVIAHLTSKKVFTKELNA